jgi:chemotaxis protein CheX
MTEEDLKVFVSGTANYFKQVASVPAEVSTPFIKEAGDEVIFDFSAVIGITGTQRGCVYYTAPRTMVQTLVSQLGEPELGDEICADFVGEIANTISGNAREALGSGFMISVPVVFREAKDVRFPPDAPSYVIPIVWKGHRSSLIICLKDEPLRPERVEVG